MSDQNSNINIALKLDDKAVKKNLSALSKSFASMNATSKQAVSGITNVTKNLKTLNATTKTTSSGLSSLSTKMKSISDSSKKATSGVENLNKGLSKSSGASKNVSKLSSSMSLLSSGVKVFVASQIGMTLVGFAKSAMDAVEAVNLFSVSMGSLAVSTQRTVDTLNQQTGLDVVGIQKAVGNYNLLGRSMGVAADKSQTLAVGSNQLAMDLASLTNRNIDQVIADLNSGLVGQSETMYKYGVDITEASLKQEAMNQGIEKSVRNMTQAEKMQLRYAVMVKQTGLAQGDFARTINQPANQLRILQERFTTLGRSVGSIFIPAIEAILPVLNAIVKEATGLADKIAAAVGFTETEPQNMQDNFTGLGNEIDSDAESVDNLNKKMQKLAGFDQINTLGSDESGNGNDANAKADIAVSGYDAGLDAITQKSEAVMDNIKNGFASIKERFSEIGQQPVFQTLAENAKNFFIDTESTATRLKNIIGEVTEDNKTRIAGVWSGFSTNAQIGFNLLVTVISDTFAQVARTVYNWVDDNSGKIKAFVESIQGVFLTAGESGNAFVGSLLDVFGSFWEKWGTKSVDTITQIAMDIVGRLMDVFTNIVAPILEYLFKSLTDVWNSGGSDALIQVGDAIGNLIAMLGSLWTNVLQPMFYWLLDNVGPYIVIFAKGVIDNITNAIGVVFNIIQGLAEMFKGLFQILQGLFEGNTDLIKDGFMNMFTGIADICAGILNGIVNVVIDSINFIIRAINQVKKATPNSTPLSELSRVDFRSSVPRLARGGVLDAGQAFVAGEAGAEMVGSYNNKTTVMPLENTSFVAAIKDAVKQGISEASGNEQTIEVNVGGKTLVNEVISGINRETRRTGKAVFNV